MRAHNPGSGRKPRQNLGSLLWTRALLKASSQLCSLPAGTHTHQPRLAKGPLTGSLQVPAQGAQSHSSRFPREAHATGLLFFQNSDLFPSTPKHFLVSKVPWDRAASSGHIWQPAPGSPSPSGSEAAGNHLQHLSRASHNSPRKQAEHFQGAAARSIWGHEPFTHLLPKQPAVPFPHSPSGRTGFLPATHSPTCFPDSPLELKPHSVISHPPGPADNC